jgi:anaerobic selenocysteine-containing dehydrogenase
MIKDGSAGRPDIYLWYCYTPAYANGDVQGNIDVLKDEKLLPYTVAIDPFYGDSAIYADLILPLRQPLVPPLGEARNFADVVVDLGKRIGFDMGWKDQEDFVRKSCEKTAKVKEAGGFEYMKKNGVLALGDTPKFESFKEVILDPKKQVCKVGDTVYDDLAEPEAICPYFGDDVVYDKDIGVWWHWKASKAKSEDEAKKKGYTASKGSYKGYIGQKIGNVVYKGFKPDKINKSGYMELYSPTLKKKGHAALPTYSSIPEQDNMKPGDLMLTTFKVCVQSHSRTQNCKYLTEIYHDNPGWMNSKDASAKGLKTGDKIKVTSPTGSIETTVLVTENVIPGVIAISHHLGHWAYGRYASGKKNPLAGDGDPDLKNKHWKKYGVHPNWVIPNSPDPINGQQRWMDTVVQVTKA